MSLFTFHLLFTVCHWVTRGGIVEYQSVYTAGRLIFLKHLILFPSGQWQDLAAWCISCKIKAITEAGQNDNFQTELKIHRRETEANRAEYWQVDPWIMEKFVG